MSFTQWRKQGNCGKYRDACTSSEAMISDDEYLERLVAGIQAATMSGAEVEWNKKINGRQFDVVARFKLGRHRILLVFEVRNRTRPAEAADVEALVTKSRDRHASKAVLVTSAGFQSGALDVARAHAIDVFTITFEDAPALPQNMSYITRGAVDGPTELSLSEPHPVHVIQTLELEYQDGAIAIMPEEPSQMNYYARQTKLKDGRTIYDLIDPGLIEPLNPDERRSIRIALPVPQPMFPPDEFHFPAGTLRALVLDVISGQGRKIEGNVLVEPTMFRLPVVYTNALTGEAIKLTIDQLPVGLTTSPKPGCFYFLYHPLRYYHCDSVADGLVTWTLVESFQAAELFQATFTQKVKYSRFYIPLKDRKTIARLRVRLQKYR